MRKRIVYFLIVMILVMSLITCQHVDKIAQTAADVDIIDRGTANVISISARAFGSAAENATPEQEYYIGRAVAANILSGYRLWEGNPELTNYLNLICHAIVLNSPQPIIFNDYHVAILDTNEVNAFATSGGHIFVTRGLLNTAKTEDALAGVLAHEIAHIQLRHGIKAIKTSRMTEAIIITAAASLENAKGMDVVEMSDIFNESVGEIMQTMVNSGYSKEQEYEADVAAMYLMGAAGYEPSGFIDMLHELKAIHIPGPGFGRTHPSPGQRIYFAEKALGRFNIASTKFDRQERFNEALKTMIANAR
ncbi:MAG: M48 family metalloprotease [Treponema sp.]|nr:M48 family metalloprotease [Treponema sp.]MCL2265630.1 M48 family metalloprotease [Treponema sp.]MCL2265653.1 M48 family metalloprotease [Treponema sp.]